MLDGATMGFDNAGLDWWPYELVWLERSQLVDEGWEPGNGGFQRPDCNPFITYIADNFEEQCVDPLIVSKIEDIPEYVGKYSVLDGKHRLRGTERIGLAYLPCLVHKRVLNYCERSLLFDKLNLKRRQLTTGQSIRARQQGKDEPTLQMLALLEDCNCYLAGYAPIQLNGHRSISADTTIQTEFNRDAAALRTALTTLRGWPSLAGKGVQSLVIGAMCDIVRREQDFNPERMELRLEDFGPKHLMYHAKEVAAESGGRLDRKAIRKVLVDQYNKHLRVGRLTP